MSGDGVRASRPSIHVVPDGPLIVRGAVGLVDEGGNPVRTHRRTVALCRCGASSIKPWCDGSHKLGRPGA
ncbi:CDGSH iron-sulfur domain-containing protein [Microbacterium sp. LRZ72]|uniref:CDGSH iron-sulfur domain-containing protein n=1 Tax=Microbacterium sp. LRZ72 TaxID=2942481 RepID=UPI0029BA3A08|nr:CDGSH iron-sulfur domain-containing protein [Microbacterium sp. LRZ72]MDX2376713.1 CDGSH iron-sulfur domain-containing protein [Microbacterium sp. LRZ72]